MSSAIIHSVSGYINETNMEFPGETTAGELGGSRFTGQKGARLTLRRREALKVSKTSVGTLYGGTYQLVQLVSSATANPIVGGAAFWSDYDDYVVTTDVPTQPGGQFAGVFINVPTKGNWCYIQVEGLATVMVETVTEAGVIGDSAFVTSSSGGKFNNLADATAVNAGNLNDYAGKFQAAPATDTLTLLALEGTVENL